MHAVEEHHRICVAAQCLRPAHDALAANALPPCWHEAEMGDVIRQAIRAAG